MHRLHSNDHVLYVAYGHQQRDDIDSIRRQCDETSDIELITRLRRRPTIYNTVQNYIPPALLRILPPSTYCVNPLECKGNYGATSSSIKLVHWPLMGDCYIWYSEEGTAGPQPAQAPPRCTKRNSPPVNGQCTNHCIYDPMLCGFNVPIKGLTVSVLPLTISHGEKISNGNVRCPLAEALTFCEIYRATQKNVIE